MPNTHIQTGYHACLETYIFTCIHNVVYSGLLKITLADAYMHIYCCACIRIYLTMYGCVYI